MLNKVTIIGNVGRDPNLRYLENGRAVCDFSVATNERWKDRESGEPRERTTWFRVTCWNGLAETVGQYVQKGRQIYIEGRVDVSAWLDQESGARATLEVRADTVKFLGRSSEDPEGPKPEYTDADIPF
jgi:single-strand DNA-binding protein